METSWRQLCMGERGVVPAKPTDIGARDPAQPLWIAGLILGRFHNPFVICIRADGHSPLRY